MRTTIKITPTIPEGPQPYEYSPSWADHQQHYWMINNLDPS
jgi:hypothetical protein